MNARLPRIAWTTMPLDKVAKVQAGVAKGGKVARDPVQMPYLRVANVQRGHLNLAEIKRITVDRSDVARFLLKPGDVLMTEGGDFDKLGRAAIWSGEIERCLHQNHVFAVRCNLDKLLPEWLAIVSRSHYGRRYFQLCSKQSTNLASINCSQLKALPIPLPPRDEQAAIAALLHKAERCIASMKALCAAKKTFKRGLAQQLLIGKKRFPEFRQSSARQLGEFGSLPADWQVRRIADIASELSIRGASDGAVVYSCTKHDGLVPSLEYFGKQVFSRNLDVYKRLSAGDFAYATNHIEEGSIGLLHDGMKPGLVSPMYTVFRCDESINPEFLFAVLKMENYRRVFERRTSASVNRRGSLRWKEFSKIRIPIPSRAEQDRIVEVLDLVEAELALLAEQREQYERYKRGLMSRLLSGEIQVPA